MTITLNNGGGSPLVLSTVRGLPLAVTTPGGAIVMAPPQPAPQRTNLQAATMGGLLTTCASVADLDSRFDALHPGHWQAFVVEAFKRINRARIPAKLLVEIMRDAWMLAGNVADDYVVNNNTAPYLGRRFRRAYPQHAHKMDIRLQAGAKLTPHYLRLFGE